MIDTRDFPYVIVAVMVYTQVSRLDHSQITYTGPETVKLESFSLKTRFVHCEFKAENEKIVF